MSGTVFYKMTGSGNDFVMLDGRNTDLAAWPAERIRAVCDRRHGVGADGFVLLAPEGPAAVRMHFFNCDGSRAPMCGNASLCSTRLSFHLGLAPAEMVLVTDSGQLPSRTLTGPGERAEIHLGDFAAPKRVAEVALAPGEESVWFANSGGPPHVMVLSADVEAVDVPARGRELRYHSAFAPGGANVNFVSPPTARTGARWPMRTYERGVEAETLACGTGAVGCAAVLAGLGRLTPPVELLSRGGYPLSVRLQLKAGTVTDPWLAGEGRLVFRGILA
ncbi:MAG TPA: diaminopimelate epimerase [Gemmatimonadales bacterium]|nr:diaminopimelate epimerase [Gemmatimonadales bacterium]